MVLSKFDVLKLLGNTSLPEIIDQEAQCLKISKMTDPKFSPPKKGSRSHILLGVLPEELKSLRRLLVSYVRKADDKKAKENAIKAAMIRALYDYLFNLKYAAQTPEGYEAQVYRGWRVIACPSF